MVDTVYTIGYSGFPIGAFLDTLRERQISLVVDVRSQPHSQWFPEYNKEIVARTLKKAGIYYRNYVKEFGARQEERKYYPNGYLDFERFAKSEAFQEGVAKLRESMRQDYRFTLMCAEKDPFNCHRAILVARAFHEAGYSVVHLLPGGGTMSHADIERRLLDKYFPDRPDPDQITFSGEAVDGETLLQEAYRKRNAEIGYSIEEEST